MTMAAPAGASRPADDVDLGDDAGDRGRERRRARSGPDQVVVVPRAACDTWFWRCTARSAPGASAPVSVRVLGRPRRSILSCASQVDCSRARSCVRELAAGGRRCRPSPATSPFATVSPTSTVTSVTRSMTSRPGVAVVRADEVGRRPEGEAVRSWRRRLPVAATSSVTSPIVAARGQVLGGRGRVRGDPAERVHAPRRRRRRRARRPRAILSFMRLPLVRRMRRLDAACPFAPGV